MEEEEAIKKAIKRIIDDWGFHKNVGLRQLLDCWRKNIEEIESGYSLCIHDYTSALSLRDEIELLIRSVPERLGKAIEQWLKPYDQRYLFATKQVEISLLPGVLSKKQSARWYRIPLILKPIDADSEWPECP